MKVKMIATILDGRGNETGVPITIETEVPELKEVGERETFLESFHLYEQAVLTARNEMGARLTENYLEQAAGQRKKRKTAQKTHD